MVNGNRMSRTTIPSPRPVGGEVDERAPRPSTKEEIDRMPGAGPPTADEAEGEGEGDGTLDEDQK